MYGIRNSRSLARMRTQSGYSARGRYLQGIISSSRSKSNMTTNRAKALSETLNKKKTNASTTTNSLNSTTKTDAQQMSAYTAIQEAITDLQKRAEKLQKKGNDSLFVEKKTATATEKETNKTDSETTKDANKTVSETATDTNKTDSNTTTVDAAKTDSDKTTVDATKTDTTTTTSKTEQSTALTEINAFVKDYNKVIEKMNDLGDTISDIYLRGLKKELSANAKSLKKIGITVNTNGTLNVKQSVLSTSDMKDLEDVFGNQGVMMNKTLKYMTSIENSAKRKITQLGKSSSTAQKSSNYNRYGRATSTSSTSSRFNTTR